MYCAKCGKENMDGAKFCSGCGASIVPAPDQGKKQRIISRRGIAVAGGIMIAAVAAFACVFVVKTKLIPLFGKQYRVIAEEENWYDGNDRPMIGIRTEYEYDTDGRITEEIQSSYSNGEWGEPGGIRYEYLDDNRTDGINRAEIKYSGADFEEKILVDFLYENLLGSPEEKIIADFLYDEQGRVLSRKEYC